MIAIRRFFAGDAAGAIVLLAATIAALIVANSPLARTYVAALHQVVGGMSVEHWINDGAMALFYTGHIALLPLLAAGAGLGVLVILNLSGVHATLAGVAVALTIPLRTGGSQPPLKRLEHALQPWSSFLIVPAFGFANAGIAFGGMAAADVIAPLPVGIMLGLFLGKQIGIFATIRGLVTLRLAVAPKDASWAQVYGMAVLCGIGFTMSLFIGGLAFAGAPHAMDSVKIGVFAGSILSGIAGWILLRRRAR
ncbi:hypothetical protein HMP09_1803 [Sphingomonas sp. HMP9]|nr:hypothetical protein HMP09_1803 [Sphingomonas sp. HMP9]